MEKNRARAFAREYVNTGWNATEALRKTDPRAATLKKPYLYTKAYRMTKSADVEEALKEVLGQKGFSSEEIAALLRRNATQNRNLSASNVALDMAIKVRGDYAPEKRAILNVFGELRTPEQEQNALRQLQKELEELTDGQPAGNN